MRVAEAAWFSHLLQLSDNSHKQQRLAALLQLQGTLVARSQYQQLTLAHGLVWKMVNTASCFAIEVLVLICWLVGWFVSEITQKITE